jgi:hypothetical protein
VSARKQLIFQFQSQNHRLRIENLHRKLFSQTSMQF